MKYVSKKDNKMATLPQVIAQLKKQLNLVFTKNKNSLFLRKCSFVYHVLKGCNMFVRNEVKDHVQLFVNFD